MKTDLTKVETELLDEFHKGNLDIHDLRLKFIIDLDISAVPVMTILGREDDTHTDHDFIVDRLTYEEDPEAIDTLFHMAISHYDYLDEDDNFGLTIKCIWSIYKANCPYAMEKLKQLKNQKTSKFQHQYIQSLIEELLTGKVPIY